MQTIIHSLRISFTTRQTNYFPNLEVHNFTTNHFDCFFFCSLVLKGNMTFNSSNINNHLSVNPPEGTKGLPYSKRYRKHVITEISCNRI